MGNPPKLPRVDRRVVAGIAYKYHRPTRHPLPAHLPEDDPEFVAAWNAAERMLVNSYLPVKGPNKLNTILRRAAERAAAKGMAFELDRDWLTSQISDQKNRCALSGMRFSYVPFNGIQALAPSIDRIDNANGYTPDNCRIVCAMVNLARLNWSDDLFIRMCRAVAKRTDARKERSENPAQDFAQAGPSRKIKKKTVRFQPVNRHRK